MTAAPTPPQALHQPHVLRLDDALTIVCAQAQRAVLLQAIDTPQGQLVLDLSSVESIDSAGVQLLLAARRTLRERNAGLLVAHPSPAVADVLHTYGLQGLLQGHAAATGQGAAP